MKWLLLLLFLPGCASGQTKFLWRTETTYYRDGTVTVSEGPDKAVTANVIGAATSIVTMEPWGILAGASAQIGESVSQVVSMPADAATTNTQ